MSRSRKNGPNDFNMHDDEDEEDGNYVTLEAFPVAEAPTRSPPKKQSSFSMGSSNKGKGNFPPVKHSLPDGPSQKGRRHSHAAAAGLLPDVSHNSQDIKSWPDTLK